MKGGVITHKSSFLLNIGTVPRRRLMSSDGGRKRSEEAGIGRSLPSRRTVAFQLVLLLYLSQRSSSLVPLSSRSHRSLLRESSLLGSELLALGLVLVLGARSNAGCSGCLDLVVPLHGFFVLALLVAGVWDLHLVLLSGICAYLLVFAP